MRFSPSRSLKPNDISNGFPHQNHLDHHHQSPTYWMRTLLRHSGLLPLGRPLSCGPVGLVRGLDRARLQRLNHLGLVIAPQSARVIQKQVRRRDKGVARMVRARPRTCSWLPPPSPRPAAHLCRSRCHDSCARNRNHNDEGAQGPVPQQAAHAHRCAGFTVAAVVSIKSTGFALSSCTRATWSLSGCQAGPAVARVFLPLWVLHPRMSPVRTSYDMSQQPYLWPLDLHRVGRAAPGLAQPPRLPRQW
jgi:hypothetical protein